MGRRALYRLGVAYHWHAAVSVGLGVAVGTAVLTGALLVGVSMRGSLREAALDRLGRVDYALLAPRFFRAALAHEIAAAPEARGRFVQVCPLILLRGSAAHAESRAVARRVAVLGVDERFAELGRGGEWRNVSADGRVVVLNQALADDLHAAPGDDVLLRVPRSDLIPTETLLGRRDDVTLTLRLTVAAIVPARGLGAFSPQPQATIPRNAYVPLATLQALLRQPGRVNALLVVGAEAQAGVPEADVALLDDLLHASARLADYGLRLRIGPEQTYVAVESESFLLPPAVEEAARAAAAAAGLRTTTVLAYLANSIAVANRPERAIPYSVVAAVDPSTDLPGGLTLSDGSPAPPLDPGDILLNEWAAEDLQAAPSDSVRLTYYRPVAGGELRTEHANFRLRGVVRLAGPAADPALAPPYPGITDASDLNGWDPPFPVDLGRIREQDEAYWDEFRTTPKAFIRLGDGQRLWTSSVARFGELTSVRVYRGGQRAEDAAAAIEPGILAQLDGRRMGLAFDAVRARAVAASAGTTDFGVLFIGFSSFLIISSALLVALLYRLAVERRAAEVGLLLAVGWSTRQVSGLLLKEGLLVAALAAAVGLVAARAYAWLLLTGLRTWWAEAVNVPFLRLYESPASYVIGYAVGVLVAMAAIAWAVRGLRLCSPRALLAGMVQAGRISEQSRRRMLAAAAVLLGLSFVGGFSAVKLAGGALSRGVAFFGGGVSVLVACLAGLAVWLSRPGGSKPQTGGMLALARLGLRNARRHPVRSGLTMGLAAVATFIVTGLHALHAKPPARPDEQCSGTGGFALFAESVVPLPYDLGSPSGRAALNVPEDAEATLAPARFLGLRLRDGDETSCLNLYRPARPRVLGAPPAMIERGGFAFAATLAQTEAERQNPWRLLERPLEHGAIPAIADEAAALWQLHARLGEDVPVVDESGREQALRLVALLKGSFLQGELIVAEEQFTRLFPSASGHAYFLIEARAADTAAVERLLERELAPFGLAVESTVARLAELQRVQNTYLLTFQSLGGLGLLLGTVGLVAVLLRNVWERRSELALLQAVGFSRPALVQLILVENAVLLAAGLLAGLASAAIVVAPHAAAPPWGSLLGMFATILGVGTVSAGIGALAALRAPLLPTLRSE